MPVKVARKKGQYRIVEDGKIAKTKNGRPMDGGGHGRNHAKAYAQLGHINDAWIKKHGGLMQKMMQDTE